MDIQFTEFRDAVNDLPNKDGTYLVMRFERDGTFFSAISLHYTVAYGWNTFHHSSDNAIDYSKDVYSDGDIVLWAEVIDLDTQKGC